MTYGRRRVRKYNFSPTKSVLNIESTVEINFLVVVVGGSPAKLNIYYLFSSL